MSTRFYVTSTLLLAGCDVEICILKARLSTLPLAHRVCHTRAQSCEMGKKKTQAGANLKAGSGRRPERKYNADTDDDPETMSSNPRIGRACRLVPAVSRTTTRLSRWHTSFGHSQVSAVRARRNGRRSRTQFFVGRVLHATARRRHGACGAFFGRFDV